MVPYLSGIETNMNDLVVGACLLFSGVVALVTFDNHSSCFYKNQEDVQTTAARRTLNMILLVPPVFSVMAGSLCIGNYIRYKNSLM